MSEILDDNKLSALRTKKFYDQLNNSNERCQDNTFYNLAKGILSQSNVHRNGSDKIMNGLCYAYGKNFPEESDSDICNFLYYWLADILYYNIIPRIDFYRIMPYLFGILTIRNGIKCKAPTYYNIFEGEHFKNIKLFFDYSKDYDTYIDQLDTQNPPLCNEEYHKYLQKYVTSYKVYEEKCKNDRTSGYCKAFNEYFKEKDPSNLSNWTCNLHNNKPEAEEKGEQVVEEPQLSPDPVRGVHPATIQNEVSSVSKQEENLPDSSDYPSGKRTSDLNIGSVPAGEPSISRTTKTIATTASVAGILVPPFLVYNFTPVRSWINKLLGRNQIYRNPLTERELIENSYQPQHFDSERNRYNISYRPE